DRGLRSRRARAAARAEKIGDQPRDERERVVIERGKRAEVERIAARRVARAVHVVLGEEQLHEALHRDARERPMRRWDELERAAVRRRRAAIARAEAPMRWAGGIVFDNAVAALTLTESEPGDEIVLLMRDDLPITVARLR